MMHILSIFNGEYGLRHTENITKHAPDGWSISTWEAPSSFPIVIDYPEDFIPDNLPETDLILSFSEHRGAAELIPEIATTTGAKAVIAPVDSEAWLPRGLARQLIGWLKDIDVDCVTPKPLCSLTETDYMVSIHEKREFDNPLISEFARYFGKPNVTIQIDPESKTIINADTIRDSVCGAARYVAQNIIGLSAAEAAEKAGLLHHHYPCLASMAKDIDYREDTLMHASGNIIKENIAKQAKPYLDNKYITPGKRSE